MEIPAAMSLKSQFCPGYHGMSPFSHGNSRVFPVEIALFSPSWRRLKYSGDSTCPAALALTGPGRHGGETSRRGAAGESGIRDVESIEDLI